MDHPLALVKFAIRSVVLGNLQCKKDRHPSAAVRDCGQYHRGAIEFIAAIRLEIRQRHVKFKLGQNRSVPVRKKIIEALHKRDRRNDARAAAALQWTIDREQRK